MTSKPGSTSRVLRRTLAGLALAGLLAVALPWSRPSQAEDSAPSGTPAAAVPSTITSAEIDALLAAHWKSQKIEPSVICDDATFLRRITLDLHGVIPSVQESAAFLKDSSPGKRTEKIAALVDADGFARNWAMLYGSLLVGRDIKRQYFKQAEQFQDWLQEAFKENRSFGETVHQILTVEGPSTVNPPVVYFQKFELKPADVASSVAKDLLGLQIQCAQCHDHKFDERWKQKDFWGFAAFFSRLRGNPIIGKGEKQPIGFFVDESGRSTLTMRMAGASDEVTLQPTFLEGGTWKGGPKESPRKALADWMTAPDNPYFARATVNRIWAHFFGMGFVNPIDDFKSDSTPSVPGLLERLSADFVSHNFDFKRLVHLIVETQAYQRSAVTNRSNAADEIGFSHFTVRPLSAEQTFYSLLQATGLEKVQMKRQKKDEDGSAVDRLKRQYLGLFSFFFENDEMEEVIQFDGSIPQVLMLWNGAMVGLGTRAIAGGTLDDVLKSEKTDAGRLDRLFLTVLSRPPTDREREKFLSYIAKATQDPAMDPEEAANAPPPTLERGGKGPKSIGKGKGKPQIPARALGPTDPNTMAFQDVLWALMNSSEFLTNH